MPTSLPAFAPEPPATTWDEIVAIAAEATEPLMAAFAAEALALARVDARCRILDVATGSGGLAFGALARGAEITAIDHAPGAIADFQHRLSRDQRWRTSALVMEGPALDLPDEIFDAAFSLFARSGDRVDPIPGWRELGRVLKPGGRVVIGTWSGPGRNEAVAAVLEALRAVWPEIQGLDQPPPHCGDEGPEAFAAALTEAGFDRVAIHPITHSWVLPSADHFLDHLAELCPAAGPLVEQLPDAAEQAFRATLRGILHARFGNGPVRFRAEALLGTGCRV